jgi:lipopolysaccharide transport system ATP-binding protein
MSSDEVVLSVRGLSKSYRIGRTRDHTTLAEALIQRIRSPFRWVEARETFWALKDVWFDVRRGDVVGVIGRNGAGKSTLLKVISRITGPTAGEVRLYGRVGSLLEVGTGFHMELTGRENIYLNGAILGMRREEIRRRFDEIVAFAGVEQFLDTPVKRYSSGMFVRLAFSVAAHLDTDLLVVDEVLAVGDLAFQDRCLGRMREVARGGRTVLFVSHNMAAVRGLCDRALVLHQGRVVCEGRVDACVQHYTTGDGYRCRPRWTRDDARPCPPLAIHEVSAVLEGEQPRHLLRVEATVRSHAPHRPAWIAVEILDAAGLVIMQAVPTVQGFIPYGEACRRVNVRIDLPPLIPGQYSLTVAVLTHNTEVLDQETGCISFEVSHSPTPGRTYPHTSDHGYIVPHATCELGA